jgi:hypothetical protein
VKNIRFCDFYIKHQQIFLCDGKKYPRSIEICGNPNYDESHSSVEVIMARINLRTLSQHTPLRMGGFARITSLVSRVYTVITNQQTLRQLSVNKAPILLTFCSIPTIRRRCYFIILNFIIKLFVRKKTALPTPVINCCVHYIFSH